MNRSEIKQMQREIRLRPYKREYREAMATIRFLGANVLIAGMVGTSLFFAIPTGIYFVFGN